MRLAQWMSATKSAMVARSSQNARVVVQVKLGAMATLTNLPQTFACLHASSLQAYLTG